MTQNKQQNALSQKAAQRCENAEETICRCRCGGALHGAKRGPVTGLGYGDPHAMFKDCPKCGGAGIDQRYTTLYGIKTKCSKCKGVGHISTEKEKTMSRSWGHEIKLITKETLDVWRGCDAEQKEHIDRGDWLSNLRCSLRCPNQKEFYIRYRYVTGRAGRTSYADKSVCREHAQKFAKKNNIQMPINVEQGAA